MAVTGLNTPPDRAGWQALREEETSAFRSAWALYDRKNAVLRPPLNAYAGYYRQFKKTYPVLLQMESVLLKGRSIQSSSLAVETMFMAEVKHGLLVAGHDLEKLSGGYTLNLARGGENFTMVAGQARTLKTDDLYMADGDRILSSILEGQDYYTRLTEHSAGALYCVYGVGGVTAAHMEDFFMDLARYTQSAFPAAQVEAGRVFTA
jgi:DNA/RNA-binding domain of Phe-tRNA-synthetase-like protein